MCEILAPHIKSGFKLCDVSNKLSDIPPSDLCSNYHLRIHSARLGEETSVKIELLSSKLLLPHLISWGWNQLCLTHKKLNSQFPPLDWFDITIIWTFTSICVSPDLIVRCATQTLFFRPCWPALFSVIHSLFLSHQLGGFFILCPVSDNKLASLESTQVRNYDSPTHSQG